MNLFDVTEFFIIKAIKFYCVIFFKARLGKKRHGVGGCTVRMAWPRSVPLIENSLFLRSRRTRDDDRRTETYGRERERERAAKEKLSSAFTPHQVLPWSSLSDLYGPLHNPPHQSPSHDTDDEYVTRLRFELWYIKHYLAM